MISNIGGFDDSESHLQLRVLFRYSPSNVAFVVVVGDQQDVVLWKHQSNSLHYAKYSKTFKMAIIIVTLKTAMLSFYSVVCYREVIVCSVKHVP